MTPEITSPDTSRSPELFSPPRAPSVSGDTVSVHSDASMSSAVSVSSDEIVIPNHWRPEVEECLKNKSLTTHARNEIVRTLASQLFCRYSRPNRAECEKLARKLILKYPFMKDNLGCGYVSSF